MSDLLDHVYDTLEKGAVLVGTALGVDMRDELRASANSTSTSTSASLAPFRIDEVIDGATGKQVFVVTDGHGSSCDCPSRAFAEQVLDALEQKRAAVVRGAELTK